MKKLISFICIFILLAFASYVTEKLPHDTNKSDIIESDNLDKEDIFKNHQEEITSENIDEYIDYITADIMENHDCWEYPREDIEKTFLTYYRTLDDNSNINAIESLTASTLKMNDL
jgi:hypothetical protein